MTKANKKIPARLRAKVKWMTHEERVNLLRGLAELVYEDEPGTPEEKRERFTQRLLEMRKERGE